MDLAELITAKRFLGNEFLLWLWHKEDEDACSFRVGNDTVEFRFDDRLQLEAYLAEAETSDLKGGAPAHSPEAHKALQVGKRVAKAKMRMLKDGNEWVFSVDSSSFALSGIRIPAVMKKEDDEPFFERMWLVEQLHDAWYGVYRLFLQERLGKGWEKSRETIAEWISKPVYGE